MIDMYSVQAISSKLLYHQPLFIDFHFSLQGSAGLAVHYLGYAPGLFIVGLIAILVLWMYANFWITGTLFIVGGIP